QNYLVGDRERVEDYECSPGGAVEVLAAGAQVAHTNHALMSTDVDPEVRPERASTTVERLASVRSNLGPHGAEAGAADLMHALSDCEAPVCVARGRDWMPLGSFVMELGVQPVLHVALGPPADTPYGEVRF